MHTIEPPHRTTPPSTSTTAAAISTTPALQPGSLDPKEAVLDAAQRLINQYGYTGFSMRDLALQCGLAKATLYHHFADKHEIFVQVLHRDLRIVCDCINSAAATPGDLRTRLRRVAKAFFALATERGMLLLSTLRQAAGMEEEFIALMRSYRDESQRPIIQMLNEAIAAGTIRPVDPELAALSFFGMLQVFTTRHLLMNDLELDDQAVDFILDLTLNGLLSKPQGDPS
jgi:AcrR family transcriptional regulator